METNQIPGFDSFPRQFQRDFFLLASLTRLEQRVPLEKEEGEFTHRTIVRVSFFEIKMGDLTGKRVSNQIRRP
ncbi:hypothetical protein [Halalkalibaculum sp. DA3122]|uniref:hypothetical protein n=1 Tax=unclassified Halalkalibaculum TaxID=2964617 RepID=UPI0037541572